jgi:hypothetical protein
MQMKKTTIILAVVALMLSATVAEAQLAKLKDKVSGKSSSNGGGGPFADFNAETDDMGLTGQYSGLVDKKPFGMRFVKEEGGKVVNSLHYFEKKGSEPQLKLNLKESYYTKNQVKLFYFWVSASATGYVELIEVAPGVIAQITSDRSMNDGPVALDAMRKVKDVYAKDKASFETWDLETAQAKVDMLISSLNTEAMEKETALWMKNEVFSKNVGKIVFADQHYHLMKQGYSNKPPMVSADNFKAELDMSRNMNYMAFFKYPPKVKYPGQEINIEYSMGGQKTNRAELRKKSAAWSNMVKILETKDFDDRQHNPRALREYNNYASQYVQDYAFINLLYLNKDKFMIGKSYDLTVKMYAHRDGENGEVIAEGVVKLKYTPEAHALFNGDPSKPGEKSVWQQFEEFLEE